MITKVKEDLLKTNDYSEQEEINIFNNLKPKEFFDRLKQLYGPKCA